MADGVYALLRIYSNVWYDEHQHVLLHQSDAGAIPGRTVSRYEEHVPRYDHDARLLARESRSLNGSDLCYFLSCTGVYVLLTVCRGAPHHWPPH